MDGISDATPGHRHRVRGPAAKPSRQRMPRPRLILRRYALPTAQWRDSWLRAMSGNYDFALRAAIDTHQSNLAAGLIELSKSQAVPLVRNAGDGRPSPLESLIQSRTRLLATPEAESVSSTAADAVGALFLANPVHPALTPVIAGARVLADTDDEGLDIDGTIRAIAGPDAFYFTGVMSGTDYYWAYRDPMGHWNAGRISMAAGSTAVGAVDALMCSSHTHGQGGGHSIRGSSCTQPSFQAE